MVGCLSFFLSSVVSFFVTSTSSNSSGDEAVELNQGSDDLLSMEPREHVKHRRRDSCELYAELCDFTGRNQGWLSALFLLVCRILLYDLERSNSGDGVWGEVAGYTRPVKKKKKKKRKKAARRVCACPVLS